MNLKYAFSLLIFLMMSNFFYSCNSCKNLEPITLYASRNLTATGVFQPGSYWIYRNDTTFETDSVIVTNYQYQLQPVYGPCGNKDSAIVSNKEFFFTTLTSITSGQNYLFSTGIAQPLLLTSNNLTDTVFIDEPCTDSAVCLLHDSLNISGLLFYNVRERIDSISNIEAGNAVHYFTANGLGIVKKEIYEPGNFIESWSLKRWHIIQ